MKITTKTVYSNDTAQIGVEIEDEGQQKATVLIASQGQMTRVALTRPQMIALAGAAIKHYSIKAEDGDADSDNTSTIVTS